MGASRPSSVGEWRPWRVRSHLGICSPPSSPLSERSVGTAWHRRVMKVVAATSLAALLAIGCSTTEPQSQPQTGAPATSTAAAAPVTAVTARAASVPADRRYVAFSDGQTGRILLVDLAKGS